MTATGLFFGSFNPIHIGHMIIASCAADSAGLKEIWFVVSPQNPLKAKGTLLDGRQRLEMVKRVIRDDERFRVCDIEFDMPRPSYTVDTLQLLRDQHHDRKFTLLLGGDSIASLPQWKNYRHILENHPLLVYSRIGQGPLPLLTQGSISTLDAPEINISSSMVRQYVAEGKESKYLMPFKAWEYMNEMNFYK